MTTLSIFVQTPSKIFQRLGLGLLLVAIAFLLFGPSLSVSASSPPSELTAAEWASIQSQITAVEARASSTQLTPWLEQFKLTPDDGAGGDDFGVTVAIEGDIAIVGAPQADISFNANQGAVYVFVRNGLAWDLQQKLTAADGQAGDGFGISVALSGDTALIGAAWANNANSGGGAAYIFTRSGATWSQEAKISGSDTFSGNLFGYSVAVEGDTAIVVALVADGVNNNQEGAVYAFTRSGGVWTEEAKLFASDGKRLDGFGTAVALSGDTVIVGAPNVDINIPGDDQGAAYVFTRSGGVWTEEAILTYPNSGGVYPYYSGLGSSVALKGDMALIGAPGTRNYQPDYSQKGGSVYVFERSGTAWTRTGSLLASDGAESDAFGASVALDGSVAVIGARRANVDGNANQGAAYVFTENGGSWTEQTKLAASDGVAGDWFGYSAGVSGETAIIGLNIIGSRSDAEPGAAYIFPTALSIHKSVDKSTPAPGDTINFSITLDNKTATTSNGVISDTLPAGLNFIGPITLEDTSGTGTVGTPPTLVSGLNLTPGDRVTVTFPVSVSTGLTPGVVLTNTAVFTAADLSASVSSAASLIVNRPPVAVAGDDQTVGLNTNIALNASGSSDPDGDIPLAYFWQQTSGPAIALSEANAPQTTFTAPDSPATLTFDLIVTDSLGSASQPDEIVITVQDPVASNNVIYVDSTASGSADGSSWTNAYTTVQSALAVATVTKQIWVAQGVYYPDDGTGQTADDPASTFALLNGVSLYGGFAGTETALTERDPATNITVLSGDLEQNDGTDANNIVTSTATITGANAYHVVTGSGTDSTATLDGFTVTAGQANSTWPNIYGGGMYNDAGSPWVVNINFVGNSATSRAGGMYNATASNPLLSNVRFVSNTTAGSGGGMFNDASSPWLNNVTFTDNLADSSGGGIYNLNDSNPALSNVTFVDNTSQSQGGGMYNSASHPELTDVSFINNRADNTGGGMYNTNSNPSLHNVTFENNTSTSSFGGGIANTGSSPTLTEVTFSGNSASSAGGMYSSFNSQATLNEVTFEGNTATNNGGAIMNQSSNPSFENVSFSHNTAGQDGGAVYNQSGHITLTTVTFAGNTADDGGGLYSTSSSTPVLMAVIFSENTATSNGGGMMSFNSNAQLTQVTVSGNAANNGGGLYSSNDTVSLNTVTFVDNTAASRGGGMYNSSTTSAFTNVTVADNSATEGGGLYNYASGTPTLLNVTFSGNSASSQGGGMYNSNSTPRLNNVIIANSPSGGDCDTGGSLDGASSNNLIEDASTACGLSDGVNGNIIGQAPNLGGLTSYGGVGQWLFPLLPGSPAIDAGDDTACAATDQRGGPRPVGTACDIGAHEGGFGFYLALTQQADDLYPVPGQALTLTLMVVNPELTATNVTLSLDLPADLNVVGPIMLDAPSGTGTVGSAPPTLVSGLTMGSGSLVTVTVPVTVAAGLAEGSTITSTASATATQIIEPLSDVLILTTNRTPQADAGGDQSASMSTMVTLDGSGSFDLDGDTPLSFDWQQTGGPAVTLAGADTAQVSFTAPDSLTELTFTLTVEDSRGFTSPPAEITVTVYDPIAAGEVLFVDDTASGTASGLSWTDAFTNLQSALITATTGQQIWVAQGIYYPDEGPGQISDTVASTFALINGVKLYGGFAGTETILSQRNPSSNVTVLSGDLEQDDPADANGVVTNTATITGANAYHVVTSSGTDETTLLDGFTITAGWANSVTWPDTSGGGMHNDNASPQLWNLVFYGNAASSDGGAMYNYNSHPSLVNVTFAENTADRGGGGMSNAGSNPSLSNVTFTGNSASISGGGMNNQSSSNPSLSNVTFAENTADLWGGGMENANSRPHLQNVTFSGNSASISGGGMNNVNSTALLTNVIIANSLDGGDCTGVVDSASSHNLIEDLSNTCNLTDTVNSNLIGQDPSLDALTDFGGVGQQVFPLLAGSLAIDAGTNEGCPATDQRGSERPFGAACDIGAFEVDPALIFSITPGVSATFVITSSTGPTLTISVPSDAVTEAIDLLYRPPSDIPSPPAGLSFANIAFILQARIGGTAQNGYTFNQPISITIEYSDADVMGLDENNLALYYWDEGAGAWLEDGITVVSHDLANNRITFLLEHLTTFAAFAPTAVNLDSYTLSTTIVGSGTVTVDPPGADCTDFCTQVYSAGTVITLSVTPAGGWQFDGWSGAIDSGSASFPLQMDGDKAITATFSEIITDTPTVSYTLSVNTDGDGTGTVTVEPEQATYNEGSVVTLTAVASGSAFFTGWSGSETGLTNPLTVTMDSDKAITATFSTEAPITHTLTMNVVGQGTVSPVVGDHDYLTGTVVSLVATPDSGWQFEAWSGAITSTLTETTVLMDADKVVTATFSEIDTGQPTIYLPIVLK